MIKEQQSIEDILAGIAMNCAYAVISGQPTVTISVINVKRPKGFPRGELLSVGTNGAKNYAVDPITGFPDAGIRRADAWNCAGAVRREGCWRGNLGLDAEPKNQSGWRNFSHQPPGVTPR